MTTVAAEPSFRLVESASRGKDPRRPNEDLVVQTPVLVAVVDGATSKHDEREWRLDGARCHSGEWAARTIGRALHDVGPDWTAQQAVDHVTAVLARDVAEAHGDVPREQLPSASLALVHGPRRELWAVGDCQWLVDGVHTKPEKRVDTVAAALRAAVHAAVAAGAEPPEGDDPGRAVIEPFLRIQGALAGTTGYFGYGHLDGRPVHRDHLTVLDLDPGAEVVLATDGYPSLHPDLAATERALAEALAADPLCVDGLRGTKGVADGADSFDDRTYVRLRLAGTAVPSQRRRPDARTTELLGHVARSDFGAVRRAVDALDLPRHVTQPVRRLSHAGQLLVDLDLEDLHSPPAVGEPLRARLREVCLPQAPAARPRGLLASLRPALDLVLDVIALRYEQRQVHELLTAVHLLHEALPLAAWEPVLGHAGDPVALQPLVSGPGSHWATGRCPSTGPGPKAARALSGATRDAEAWQHYLERSWSLLGTQLADCATCSTSCAVGAAPAGSDLRQRLALRSVLGRSALLGLRHGSTVGHAFAVPDLHEVDRAWRGTRKQLTALAPTVAEDDGHPLPGLRTLVGTVAGEPLASADLLGDVRQALRREVEELAGDLPT